MPLHVQRTSVNSTYSSKLSFLCNAASAGVYYLNVTASGQDKSHSVTLALVLDPGNSSISISVKRDFPSRELPESLTVGENLTISGAISPPHQASVTLEYTRPDGSNLTANLNSASDGTFRYTLKTDAPGSWTFSAMWYGDMNHVGAESRSVTIAVKQPLVSLIAEFFKQLATIPTSVLNAVASVLLIVLLVVLLFVCGCG